MAVPYKSTTAIPARNIEITPRPRSIVGHARSSMNLAIGPDPSHVIHGRGSKSSRKWVFSCLTHHRVNSRRNGISEKALIHRTSAATREWFAGSEFPLDKVGARLL